jgi:hypothetical protein
MLHPEFIEMIYEAIAAYNRGWTGPASGLYILKYIEDTYDLDKNYVSKHAKVALKEGVESGELKQESGVGVRGSFKIGNGIPPKATKNKVVKIRARPRPKKRWVIVGRK